MGEKIVGNRYEIIKKVGDGGMAHVYQARDKVLNRIVALKVLRQEFIDDDEFLGKFRREAESVANLSDPNIVNVFDVGRDNDVHYIVMEYVEGKNLKDIIRQEGILDEYSALDITKQIARALSHAHRKGIIHRDIKPHNILISNEGRNVKVTDFGIAKAVSNSTMTNVGNIIGSVHYFSPEQAKGKSVSKNADLYSLGIVLYEMITGRVPFRGDSPVAIALQHINESVEFGDDEITRIPQSVRTIIKKLTEKSPINRYQSAEELIDDIEYIEKNIDLDFIKEYDSYATKKTGELYNYKKTEKVTYENTLDNVSMDTQDEQDDSEKITRSKKQQEKKANKRLIIVAVILGIILIAQLAFFSLFLPNKFINSSGDVMPDVYNISLEDASRIINQLDIDATLNIREEYSDDVEVGFITSQSPIKGTKLSDGDIVNLVISKGSLEVYDASNDEVEEYIAPVEPPKEEVVEPEVEPEPEPYIPPSINIIGYTLE
ncbi:MAG: Stk1 family PASTA domain-containing Ser/Thr kinase, partial [Peptostreptococcaceae bacterium]